MGSKQAREASDSMTNMFDIPLSLMRMALALLDNEGAEARLVAAPLQAAIDVRTGARLTQKVRNRMTGSHDTRSGLAPRPGWQGRGEVA